MKKRILVGNKFVPYTGKVEKYKTTGRDAKIAQRKDHEALAEKAGFDPNNPDEGGLSQEDVAALTGMSYPKMVTLANARKIDVPDSVETADQLRQHLMQFGPENTEPAGEKPVDVSMPSRESVEKKSIPELRAMAKEFGIKVPSSARNKAQVLDAIYGVDSEDGL